MNLTSTAKSVDLTLEVETVEDGDTLATVFILMDEPGVVARLETAELATTWLDGYSRGISAEKARPHLEASRDRSVC